METFGEPTLLYIFVLVVVILFHIPYKLKAEIEGYYMSS